MDDFESQRWYFERISSDFSGVPAGVGGKFEMADPGGTGSDRIRPDPPDPTGSGCSQKKTHF